MSRVGATILIVGLLVLLAGWFLAASPHNAMQSYLAAWLLVMALPIGALPVVMTVDLVALPPWATEFTRSLRRMCWGIPVAGLLLIPVLAAYVTLFAAPHRAYATPFARWWLSPAPFIVRSAIYLIVWSVLGLVFAVPPRRDRLRRRNSLAGIGLGLYVVLGTLAAVDWAMTTESGWGSAVFGLIFLTSQVLMALTAAALLAGAAWRQQAADQFAMLLLAASTVWLFLQFIQFLVIWSADRPNEIVWYLRRDADAGRTIEWIGLIGGFLIPAVALGSTRLRRIPGTIGCIAILLLVVHGLEMLWLVTPSYRHHFALRGLDIAGIIGLLGVLFGALLLAIARRDPALETGNG